MRTALTRLVEARPELADRLEADVALADALTAVTAASRSLTRLCLSDAAAIDVLANLSRLPPGDLTSTEGLASWKRLELLRIAARDLLGRDGLEEAGRALAELADAVLSGAHALTVGEDVAALAVIGMGKLGGSELNYASDVDILLVGASADEDMQRRARRLMEVARSCFRVDADLRPEGRSGPLVRSVSSFRSYWERWAQAWEIQALIKARPVAGDPTLGSEFIDAASARLWSRAFGVDELREVRDIKARSEAEMSRRGLAEREVKRGRGGIRDIEMAVQLLQLVHGRHDPGLRTRSTLPALAELASAGYIGTEDSRSLADAYRFLRTVEHRLQLVEEAQVHAIPTHAEARAHLARVMGYRDEASETALARFEDDLARHQATVRSIHERLFFRPLLEAFARLEAAEEGVSGRPPADGVMTEAAVQERLAAFGFSDADRTRAALQELTRGLTRSSRLMQQMLPLVLDWLSESPDPDLGLLGLRRLVATRHQRTRMVETFRESPETARRLCLLLGTSRLLLEPVLHNPELIVDIGSDRALSPRGRDDLIGKSDATLGWRTGTDERQEGLRRLKETETARIAARDVLGGASVEETGNALTVLAESVVEAALASLDPPVPIAVVAMGRFGGAELSYASDLDLLLVFDGRRLADVEAAEALAERLLRLLRGETPAERIYPVDPGLRPEGSQGALARSIQGYASYYERWAGTWERQALVRARPVAGDHEVARRFMELVDRFVWEQPLDEESRREIRRMKARMERERIPADEDPLFHLKLGRGSLSDVEWTAQLLQMENGIRAQGTMAAIEALVNAGAMASEDAAALADAYRFCERTRNRWYLVRGAPSDSLPTQADQLARLARSLDTTATDLRETYRRVTRRSRHVMERLFYGIGASPP